jgi:serine/threonine protein kinase
MLRGGYGASEPDLPAILATLLEVALALRHLHLLQLVHCDLKPANVLLKSSLTDPRGFTSKLSDFGLVKINIEAVELEALVSAPRRRMSGTITHLPPEMLAGNGQVDFSVDVYSFGVLMWELYTSHPVYLGLNSNQIKQQVGALRHPRAHGRLSCGASCVRQPLQPGSCSDAALWCTPLAPSPPVSARRPLPRHHAPLPTPDMHTPAGAARAAAPRVPPLGSGALRGAGDALLGRGPLQAPQRRRAGAGAAPGPPARRPAAAAAAAWGCLAWRGAGQQPLPQRAAGCCVLAAEQPLPRAPPQALHALMTEAVAEARASRDRRQHNLLAQPPAGTGAAWGVQPQLASHRGAGAGPGGPPSYTSTFPVHIL